ncbi:putative phytosulfokines 6 [Cardamine amara subsp. amara]|uniref:Phytosulfokine n=1 Tax=Cardamine amara subsp. amara TaxID=228776 RepID=A0ABD0ZAC5_CARAN
MKQTLCLAVCILFLIFSTSSSAIRKGKENPELNPLVSATPVEEDSVNKLMGMDDCVEGDEECLRRRMMTETHLDYIYTQHHKH